MSLCWKFSQISGIVQNVSMLIMVVMRIVAAVGGEKGSERVSLEPGRSPRVQIPFMKRKCFRGVVAPTIHS